MPYTLLLADDSVTIQRVIELTFADQDVRVVAVSDGDQAIERLEASPPDIVLADIGMPGKNGYEVAQYMRRSPRLAHIPVVLLTGAFEPIDQARAAEAGCDGVLAKPFEPQLVIGRVKELLARPSAASPAPDAARAEPVPTPAAPVAGWPPAAAQETPLAAAAASDAGPVDLDAYFDRLDAAFSNLPSNAPAAPVTSNLSPAPSPATDPEIDWFSAMAPAGTVVTERWDVAAAAPATTETPDLPLSHPSAQPPEPLHSSVSAPIEPIAPSSPAPAAEPVAASVPSPTSAFSAPAAPLAPAATPQTAALPPLADAFAALLAAEEYEGASAAAPVWPGTPLLALKEQIVDEVTRRVLDRLSEQVVRDTVADIVSKVAEQLVRDEIERIKAAIK